MRERDIGDGTNCTDDIIAKEDEIIESLIESGIQPMPWFDPGSKPNDLNTYANCVKKVGQHFIDKFDNDIKIFRFSNEPDGSWTDWGPNHTQSDPLDVAATYEAWAKALKEVNASFILEGPGIMTISQKNGKLADWVRKFLDYLKNHDVPLDIFSFHIYSPAPKIYYRDFAMVSSEIKNYPISPLYGVPKLANDEWQIELPDYWSGEYKEQFDMTWAASAQLTSVINMVQANVELSVPTFGIDTDADKLCHDFLPISCSGKAKPMFYAHQVFNQLANTKQLAVTGGDRMNLAVISGIKEDDSDHQIIFILSSYDVAGYQETFKDSLRDKIILDDAIAEDIKNAQVYQKFHLKVENAPWNRSAQISVKKYLIDDNNPLALAENGEQLLTIADDGSVSLGSELAAPQIQVITFSLADKTSRFSLAPALEPDANYGKVDSVGKEAFESALQNGATVFPH